ncbi:MAG: hypothetical protein ABI912_10615 [Actinomycetota bacterium]
MLVRKGRASTLRYLAIAMMSTALVTANSPASAAAAAPVVTRVGIRVSPSTVRVGSVFVVSGSVTPRVAGVPVVLQRLVGTRWRTLAGRPVSAAGAFSFSLRAPAPAGVWLLRVARVAAPGVRAGASVTTKVVLTKTAFAVTAAATPTVAAGQPVVVTGSVTPRAAGTVLLQRLQGPTWRSISTAPLSGAATYRLSAVLPVGSYSLRVVRTFTATTATGVSRTLLATVLAPPVVVTSALPGGTVGARYSALLAARSGRVPYAWSASGLPAGLVLTSDGRLWGTPIAAGTSTATVTVLDANGLADRAALRFTVRPAEAGRVWAWGGNHYGFLGTGSSTFVLKLPAAVPGLTDVTALATSGTSTYALRADGTVSAWGLNKHGELGIGTTSGLTTAIPPTRIPGLTDATAVAAGTTGSGYALRADGTVVAWGYNDHGQLGNATVTEYHAPVPVAGLDHVTDIAANAGSAYALRSDGTVWAWGFNDVGQLGDSTTSERRTPVRVSGLTGIVAIAAGGRSGYAIRFDGTAWAWGFNATGQLGDGSTKDQDTPVRVYGIANAAAISSGAGTAYALLSDGKVWAWGKGALGALGNGTVKESDIPVRVSLSDGVVAIAAGVDVGYALRFDDRLFAWGAAEQLGNGSTAFSAVPVVIGLRNTVGIAGGGYAGMAIERVVPVG